VYKSICLLFQVIIRNNFYICLSVPYMTFSFAQIFRFFAGFLGLIIAVVILAMMRGRSTVRFSLASHMGIGALTVILGTFNSSAAAVYFPYLLRIDSPIHYLYGPASLFYVYSSLYPEARFKPIHLLNFIPFLVTLIQFFPFYISPLQVKLAYIHQIQTSGTYVMPLHYFLKTVSMIGYYIVQLVIYYRYRKRNEHSSSDRVLNLWFTLFFSGQFIMFCGMLYNQVPGLISITDPFSFAMTMVTLMMLGISVGLMFFPSLLYGTLPLKADEKSRYVSSKLGDEEKIKILSSVKEYFSSDEKPYLNKELSLSLVATVINIGSHQLSQVINEKAGCNFNDFINAYRIEESKRILESDKSRKLKIDTIALMAGFKSKTPFYRAFKEHTNTTPKQYMDQIRTGTLNV
jgi:AraC-like DNA-binding protein